jgi:hypothetical protein
MLGSLMGRRSVDYRKQKSTPEEQALIAKLQEKLADADAGTGSFANADQETRAAAKERSRERIARAQDPFAARRAAASNLLQQSLGDDEGGGMSAKQRYDYSDDLEEDVGQLRLRKPKRRPQ